MATKNKRQLIWLFGMAACCVGIMFVVLRDADARPSAECPSMASETTPAPGVCSYSDPPPKQPAEPDDPAVEDDEPPVPAGLRKLTPQEINRIRFMELRAMRTDTDKPDRVTVKIPKQTVDDYLAERADDYIAEKRSTDPLYPDLTEAEKEKQRREFRKLTAPQKLHWIARHTGTRFADRVEIKSDPEVFRTFKKNVLPTVLRGCTGPGCHASDSQDEVIRFRLFNDPKKADATTYADFIMLNDIEVEGRPLINRSKPEDSLLLTYMLPSNEKVKPALRHSDEVKFKPPFRTRAAPGLRRIEAWIRSLKHPADDYGVRLIPKPDDLETDQDETVPPSDEPKPPDEPKQQPSVPDKKADSKPDNKP